MNDNKFCRNMKYNIYINNIRKNAKKSCQVERKCLVFKKGDSSDVLH